MGAFAGDPAKRRRAKFVPGESAVRVHQTKEPEHKQDFDGWLARIICYAFQARSGKVEGSFPSRSCFIKRPPPQWAVTLGRIRQAGKVSAPDAA